VQLLTTDAFTLRHWRADDLAAFFDLYSRWDVMRWLGAQPRRALEDLDEARARLARWQKVEQRVVPPFGLWALVPSGQASPVGTVLLLPLDDAAGPTDQVEVGWHLHPQWQGRGLVTRAARELLVLARESGHHRVLAVTDDDNQASQAVAHRLGMVDEGLTERWFGQRLRVLAWTAPHD
jgi:RimJ/RimL family protein N-acetyltransferase